MWLIVQGFILQQDIDPKHNTKNDLRKNEEGGKIENMKWQTQSPDLIPIKLVVLQVGLSV